ncbi:anthranilate synthase component I [Candidatus Sumerlaeota bacterium]|nr:anthranilate synthase component I [Candidatus Sumerlaeota bacterium]
MNGNILPTREEFRELAKQGNLIPVRREIVADLETPVSAYLKLAQGPYAFLLESVEQGEIAGRYSFMGADPVMLFMSKGREVTLRTNGETRTFETQATALDELRKVMAQYQEVDVPGMPPFNGGAVGYMAYDTVRDIEDLPSENPDDLDMPDNYFMIADSLVAFDHVKHRMILIANAHVGDDGPDAAYDRALERIEAMRLQLKQPYQLPPLCNGKPVEPLSNFTQPDFEKMVEHCKEYILAGDIFQVVPSQRWAIDLPCDSFHIYRALRAINPSPYMFYLKMGDVQLAGSSPEILCRLKDGRVTVRPIAGTRPRGATKEEDLALEKELLADPKERAEHVMLIDLGRNDIGRVSKFGTVKADEVMVIERYSHVMHIVSNVTGEINDGLDAFDLIKATFPAGTLSGAPKIRAMEIIEEMEPVRRGPYGGAVGYFSFNGNLDSCIIIRTVVVKGDKAYIQAGAGIVADSNPTREFEETCNKARGMLRAVEWAARGLDQ